MPTNGWWLEYDFKCHSCWTRLPQGGVRRYVITANENGRPVAPGIDEPGACSPNAAWCAWTEKIGVGSPCPGMASIQRGV